MAAMVRAHPWTAPNQINASSSTLPKRSLVPTKSPTKRQRLITRAAAGTSSGETLSAEQIEARLRKAVNMVTTSDKLLPYDPNATNLGLIMWQTIREIPESHRPELINRLSSAGIRRLWKIAGQRYIASKGSIMAALGPDYTVWRDLPADYTQIVYHSGKAALPVHTLGISKFQKAFFLRANIDPDVQAIGSSPGEDEEVFGRVIHPTPIANYIYPGPMYFKASIGTAPIPGLGELCDMVIRYEDPEGLPFRNEDIPRSSWPKPKRQIKPFDLGYTDYVRAVGPGVFVGVGFRTRAQGDGLWPLLYFAMAKERVENLA